jgi:hypothetical protein
MEEGTGERFDHVFFFGLHCVVFRVHLHLLVHFFEEVFVEERVRTLGHASKLQIGAKISNQDSLAIAVARCCFRIN